MLERLMKNMEEKYKILLVKAFILLTILSEFLMLFFVFVSHQQINCIKHHRIYNKLGFAFFIISCISAFIMFLLMTRVNIKAIKTKSIKLKANFENAEEMIKKLEKNFLLDGYETMHLFNEYAYSILYTYKEINRKNYVIMLIETPEMTEEIYKDYFETMFEKLGNHLLEKEIINSQYDIYFTILICVDRVTKYFSKYIEENLTQEKGKYLLNTGISFGSNTIYIASQESLRFKRNYKELKEKFLNYISDIIEVNTNRYKSKRD